ncbi:MAG: hypothetical protein IJX77_01745 [Ruminococcus sp.]|nr:hypothetical protein [Ruminococcus sp.]
MNVKEAFIILVMGFTMGCYIMYKLKPSPPEPQPKPMDFVQLLEMIERMNASKNRLFDIEEMLTSVQLCDDEHPQHVRCSWNNAGTESDCGYTFNVNNSSNRFVELAEEERIELRNSLLNDVDELVALRRYGVTQSVTQREAKTKKTAAGEGYDVQARTV